MISGVSTRGSHLESMDPQEQISNHQGLQFTLADISFNSDTLLLFMIIVVKNFAFTNDLIVNIDKIKYFGLHKVDLAYQ